MREVGEDGCSRSIDAKSISVEERSRMSAFCEMWPPHARLELCVFRAPRSSDQKSTNVMRTNNGSRNRADQSMKPKKLGILTPASSAIALTMKLGALPI